MLDRWTGKKIDLKLLSESLVHFFEEKGFSTILETKSTDEYRVIAVPKHPSNIQGIVNAIIRGHSEDFEVEFGVSSNSRFSRLFGVLATIFGGGIVVLKDLKSKEELEKLETKFWSFVDKKTDSLSAASSR